MALPVPTTTGAPVLPLVQVLLAALAFTGVATATAAEADPFIDRNAAAEPGLLFGASPLCPDGGGGQIDLAALALSAPPPTLPHGVVSVVEGYGADPTGVRDATQAMQAAITAARTDNFTLFLPVGCYRITQTLNATEPRNGQYLASEPPTYLGAMPPHARVLEVAPRSVLRHGLVPNHTFTGHNHLSVWQCH